MCLFVAGCASQTTITYNNLNPSHLWYDSNECKSHRESIDEIETTKWVNFIISPIAVIASGAMLIPAALATNTTLDWDDKTYANNMSKWCGGDYISQEKIEEGVAVNTVWNVVKSLFISNITNSTSTTK